ESATTLPTPPTADERDLYFGPQWRWVMVVAFASTLIIVIGLGIFLRHHERAWFLLGIPVVITLIAATTSLVTSTRVRRYQLADHRSRVQAWHPDSWPSVDVFLPSAGEDLLVLTNTYYHVSQLEWPGVIRTWVLDDSAREQVHALAAAYGLRYLSRPDCGAFRKAGNLQYGLEHSSGDLILLLDADFVPRKDALRELVPYFDDEHVGIVQSPQYFDVSDRMSWIQRGAASVQTAFYRWIQPSRDSSDGAICVGTSAMYRRSALERAGGFPQTVHSEDVFTGVSLIEHGSGLRYVPVVVTKGLCPNRLDQFLAQQYRWCSGSLALLFSRDFHRLPLRPMQRLSFWAGFLHYISTALIVFAVMLPQILMAALWPEQMEPGAYLVVAMGLVVGQAIVPFITLERSSMVRLAQVENAYGFSHALALFDFLRRRTDPWSVTGTAGTSATGPRARRLAVLWCAAMQIISWALLAWRIPTYGLFAFAGMLVFTVVNLIVVAPLVVGDTISRRRGGRGLRQWFRTGSRHKERLPHPLRRLATGQRLPRPSGSRRRMSPRSWPYLGSIALLQTGLALRPGYNDSPFLDEGLYLYMGHRMIDHLLHGTFLPEDPGKYFSGAPGFYPVLAALGDSVGGVQGARAVSLIGVIGAMVGVFGFTRVLFGRTAGLFAALTFATFGSVIYQSHLAVYDSWMMMFVAFAAWLTVYSVEHDGFAWSPVVGVLLTLAFFTKYAGAVYVPIIGLIAIAVGWRQFHWLIVRRALYMVATAVVTAFFILAVWGSSLYEGIETTTTSRTILLPVPPVELFRESVGWLGPSLLLAALGAVIAGRRHWRLSVVLLLGSVVGVAQQIHIGEGVSIYKHLAFGMVFAGPLIGYLFARVIRHLRWLTVPAVAVVSGLLLVAGMSNAQFWLTNWPQDQGLVTSLRSAIALNPTKAVLAEEGSPERYVLRDVIAPLKYNDTYYLSYQGLTGVPAYKAAIDQVYFGVIYLDEVTENGRWVYQYLTHNTTAYVQRELVPRYAHGQLTGYWTVYVPKVSVQVPSGTTTGALTPVAP
ncbi:MAG: glycosyltransferase family 2 protein, partial [Candidatus Nanopelagicales bacterium]